MDDIFYQSARLIDATQLNNQAAHAVRVNGERMLPADIEEEELFTFITEMSSSRVDAYFTHMSEKTLRNFADDAKRGVSFLDSHDSRKLGVGYTYSGDFEQGDVMRSTSGVYVPRGVNFGGNHSFASTNDFIAAVKARTVRDVSVGFYGGSFTCDICGEPVWGRTDCPHFPGVEYAIGEQGNDTVIATAEIDDAHLAELSAVYDGATPGAMILKFERGLTEGWLDRSLTETLEKRYRVALPDEQKRKIWTFNNPKASEADDMDGNEEKLTRENEKALKNAARALEILAEVDVAKGDIHEAASAIVDAYNEQASRIKGLEGELAKATAEVTRLTPMADDGKAYRDSLVSDALAEGVRANGETFAEETYRKMLESADIATVRQMRDDWKKLGDVRFKPGRQTSDENENQQPERENDGNTVPDKAYSV